MRKRKQALIFKKGTSMLAVAVMSATLLTGNAMPLLAQGTAIEASAVIPENVTIETPTALENIELPESAYGTLTWVEESFVPSRRVQSCEVEFKPYSSVDLSGLSGWDESAGVLTGTVTVVVSSIPSEKESDDWYDCEEAGDTETDTLDEETQYGTDGAPEVTGTPGATETPGAGENPEVSGTPGATETPGAGENPEVTGTPGAEQEPGVTETPEISETPEATETPGATPTPEQPEDIFSRPEDSQEPEVTPVIPEGELTEEEMAAQAAINHTSQGITVFGINLPWYVQFRATGGSAYEFTNEEEAVLFKSYNFELWDLKNNTEYEIPEGEYISVTMPVKEGYDYTVEHLLDNGAMETIVPSVNGSTLVFSTHSFSPFGIAGSQNLIGGDILDKNYATPTPTGTSLTITPTGTPSVTKTAGSEGNNGSNTGNTGNAGSSTDNAGSDETNNSGTTDYSGSTDNTSGGTGQSTGSTSSDSNSSQGETVNAVQTGDYTQILPFVLLVAAAAAIIGIIVYLKKKK